MKKQITHSVQAPLLRGAFYLLLLLPVCVSPFAFAQRNTTKPRRGQVWRREHRIGERDRALPANIILVTNTNDSGPGSLRAALAVANDGDTIDATGISGTILLTSGELIITQNVTIDGPGAGTLAINGNATSRVFNNNASPDSTKGVTISGFTITNGNPNDGDGGGGIRNETQGTLMVNNCTVSENSAIQGGGIFNEFHGTVMVSNCAISGNTAAFDGGGISNIAFDDLTMLIITNCTISGNSSFNGDGGGISNGAGGSVTSSASVTVTNSIISDNISAEGGGGGISNVAPDVGNFATLTINDSTISGNHAGCSGGGIFSTGATLGATFGATLTVMNSMLTNNSVGLGNGCSNGGNGGGISTNVGMLTVTNSTINSNGAGGIGGHGGGIWLSGEGIATVTDSTISDNFGNYGGAILNDAPCNLTVEESTLSGNSASNPGGDILNFGETTIRDTILNAGEFGGTLFNDGGTVTSLGYNLASDDGGGALTGPGDQINTDPMLGPLQDNGGPTFTHALLPGSPAINAGDPSFTPPPFFDQRGPGFDRVVNSRIDIGSFEVQVGSTPTPTPTSSVTPTVTATATATPAVTATPTATATATPRVTPRPRPTPHPRPTP
jgi:hypothetical protein